MMFGLEDWQVGALALGFVLLVCAYMAAVGPDPSDVPPSSFDL